MAFQSGNAGPIPNDFGTEITLPGKQTGHNGKKTDRASFPCVKISKREVREKIKITPRSDTTKHERTSTSNKLRIARDVLYQWNASCFMFLSTVHVLCMLQGKCNPLPSYAKRYNTKTTTRQWGGTLKPMIRAPVTFEHKSARQTRGEELDV